MSLKSSTARLLCLAVFLAAPTLAHSAEEGLGGIVWGKHSDRWEVRGGAAAFDFGPTTPYTLDGVALNAEVLAPSPDFLAWIGSPRPYLGTDIAFSDEPIHFVYAGVNWEAHLTSRLYVGFSAGGSYNSDTQGVAGARVKDLGSHLLFHLQASIGFDINDNTTIQVYANHYSNAGIAGSNDGLENTGARLGFRF